MEIDGLELLESDYLEDGHWAPDILSYHLWFDYLAMSPSYELARRDRAGKMTAKDKAARPNDFKKVLKVYDDFGDVRGQKFLTWWRTTGKSVCAVRAQNLDVSLLTVFENLSGNVPDPSEEVRKYIEEEWMLGGSQNTMLVAIPLNLSKAKIFREIAFYLEAFPDNAKTFDQSNLKYNLTRKKISLSALRKYERVFKFRITLLDWELWRLGLFTEVSDAYSSDKTGLSYKSKIDRNATDLDPYVSAQDRRVLTILTSRAIKRGYLISENAARGVFPSYEPSKDIAKPNFEELRARKSHPKFKQFVTIMNKAVGK